MTQLIFLLTTQGQQKRVPLVLNYAYTFSKTSIETGLQKKKNEK